MKFRYNTLRLILACLFVLTSCSISKKWTEVVKPNVVIIFTDDQGYADLGCFGGEHVYTPNIDKIAEEGARLTSFYVAAPLCTPSRAALMTGCYLRRVSMEPPSSLTIDLPNVPEGKRFPVCLAADGNGLNSDEITIAEVALASGYKTGMFGKWHSGNQPEFLPTKQGFEGFYGLLYSHDMCYANFEDTAQLMAVARAMSGGPIYLSDVPEHIDDAVLKPLTYADGRILGTLAPAIPLPESLMQDPYHEDYQFTLGSRKEKLVLISPINHGWSIIGRPDKYLSASTFELIDIDENSPKIQMVEDGPLLLWSKNKVPHSANFEFTKRVDGLWYGELIQPNSGSVYTIAKIIE